MAGTAAGILIWLPRAELRSVRGLAPRFIPTMFSQILGLSLFTTAFASDWGMIRRFEGRAAAVVRKHRWTRLFAPQERDGTRSFVAVSGLTRDWHGEQLFLALTESVWVTSSLGHNNVGQSSKHRPKHHYSQFSAAAHPYYYSAGSLCRLEEYWEINSRTPRHADFATPYRRSGGPLASPGHRSEHGRNDVSGFKPALARVGVSV
jgi:hypothetical protein